MRVCVEMGTGGEESKQKDKARVTEGWGVGCVSCIGAKRFRARK